MADMVADMEVDMVVDRVAEKSGPNGPRDFYVIKIALSVVSEVPPWALDVFHRYKQRFGNFLSCINFALTTSLEPPCLGVDNDLSCNVVRVRCCVSIRAVIHRFAHKASVIHFY